MLIRVVNLCTYNPGLAEKSFRHLRILTERNIN